MRTEIDNISIVLPEENNAASRKLIFEDDGEFLQINFKGDKDERSGCITLDKDEIKLLVDVLNTYIKNKLID